MTEWINLILTALASMGVGGIGAIWYSKRKAKAEVSQVEVQTDQIQLEVVKSVQDVYNSTIERLQQDRDELLSSNNELKREVAALKEEMLTQKQEISVLKQEVENNRDKLATTENMLDFLSPLTCCIRNCADRVEYAPGMDLTKIARKRKQIKNGSNKGTAD